jgi:hypothetical protein
MLEMDTQSGACLVPSSILVRWNNYKRSRTGVLCPKCLDYRALYREDELLSHVTQHHPEVSENLRGGDEMVALRAWLRQEMHQDDQ